MVSAVAEDGGEQAAGPYLVGYAVEEAEGMYTWSGGELQWQEPGEENLHVEYELRPAAGACTRRRRWTRPPNCGSAADEHAGDLEHGIHAQRLVAGLGDLLWLGL
jgi:hypothetical protein